MKKKKTFSLYESAFESKVFDLYYAKDCLEAAVQQVAARKVVIDFYPEGPDKETARKELADSQHSLICRLGRYESLRAEVLKYYQDNYKKLSHCESPSRFSEGHDVVMIFAKNSLGK